MRLRATRISGIGASRSFIAIVAVAPVNTAAPVITQTVSVLSVTTGTWTGTAPITYSYQWSRNGTSISGATGSSYSIPPAGLNALFGCIVTATNAAGNASAPAATLYVGLLDVLSVQSAASFTLRRLRRDQGANLTRVRRSTDQAETNIGFATVAQTRTNLDRVPAAHGDSRASAGIAITIVGTGTEFGQSYIDIRWNGTATTPVNLRYCPTILTASPNATTNALVTPGQTYTCSMGYQLIAGTFPAVTSRLTQFYRNGTALVGEANNSLPTAPTTALQRAAVVGIAPANAAYVQNIFQMDGASGIVVDFTMRFYAPNTELGTGNARPLLQRYVAETVAAVGDLDAEQLLNFVGSANAFITKWYDNSGNSRNQVQVTPASQPQIVNAGAMETINRRPAVNNLIGGFLQSGAAPVLRNTSGAELVAVTQFATPLMGGVAGGALLYVSSGLASASTRLSLNTNPASGTSGSYSISGRRLDADAFTTAVSPTAITSNPVIWRGNANYANANVNSWINGFPDIVNATFQTAGNTSDTDAVSTFVFGVNASQPIRNNTRMSEAFIFSNTLSTADALIIERNQGDYFGI